MANQKVENILNLSLEATSEEREKSEQLEVGYEPEDGEWNLIIKYSGSLDSVRSIATRVSVLLGGYAIVTVREPLIEELAALPDVEYIEKPKRLYFQVTNGKRVSCIDAVQDSRFSLFGQGVFVGIVDSGIDFTLEDFRNPDGTTRIRALWDQSLEPMEGEHTPELYGIGVEYTMAEINRALEVKSVDVSGNTDVSIRTRDISGHGTAVAGIAAGRGERGAEVVSSGGLFQGVAPESELIIVKMGIPKRDGFPRTTELMIGIDYVIRKAMEFGRPVAINVSFGNTYGAHEPYN